MLTDGVLTWLTAQVLFSILAEISLSSLYWLRLLVKGQVTFLKYSNFLLFPWQYEEQDECMEDERVVLLTSTAGAMGSILGQVTKILHVTWLC